MTPAEKLKTAADEAYRLYPKSCSHSVWHVIKKYTPDRPYVPANGLLAYLTCDPRWKRVELHELETHANQGTLVVGGLSDNPNGHVVVVYPGKAKMAGGYTTTYRGKALTVGPRGPYALAMSTSIGSSWPGAMSKGDKTVWDPWGNDDKFRKVKFWRFDPAEQKSASQC